MGRKRSRRPRKITLKNQIGNFFRGLAYVSFKILPLVIITLLVGGLFFGLKTALYADAHLNLNEIAVYPQRAIPIVRLQSLQSRYLGKNLLSIDLSQIAKELEKDPNIRDARVTRDFPNKLIIDINSRLPIGVIQLTDKGKYGIISRDGMILDVVSSSQPGALLIDADGLNVRGPYIGQKITHPVFSRFLNFLDAFNQNPISQQLILSGVKIDRFENISIILRTGQEVRLGRYPIDRIPALYNIISIINTDDQRLIEYIDLQYDDVIVKRKR